MKRFKSMELVSRIRNDRSEVEQLLSNNDNGGAKNTNQFSPRHSTSRANEKSLRGNSSTNQVYFIRRIFLRWKLMPASSRIAVGFILTIIAAHIVFGTVDIIFHQYGLGPDESIAQGSQSKDQQFAVVINTYKRPEMLRKAVRHYAETCGPAAGVGQVFVVWAEQGTVLPTVEEIFEDTKSVRTTNSKTKRSEVHVLQKDKDSLNSRFEPIPQLTSEGIFMVDDDVRVACPSLTQGFLAWKARPDSMAGYYPRLASAPRSDPTSNSELIYHTWPHVFARHKFNFVLTKASFLHIKYLELYSSAAFPQEIKDYVDKHMNCEDVAMSLLVANYTIYNSEDHEPAPPIYVEGTVQDLGLFNGISTGSGHMVTRSKCLTELTAVLGEHGWKAPLDYQLELKKYSWLQHRPGFWFQSRPSNFFEWFSFANTLT